MRSFFCWNMKWSLTEIEWRRISLFADVKKRTCAHKSTRKKQKKRDEKCTEKSSTTVLCLIYELMLNGDCCPSLILMEAVIFWWENQTRGKTSNAVIPSPKAFDSKCFTLCSFILYSAKANKNRTLTYTTRLLRVIHALINLIFPAIYSKLVGFLWCGSCGFGFCWTLVLLHFWEVFFSRPFWRVGFRGMYEIRINFYHL